MHIMMSKNSGNFNKLDSLTPNTCSNGENLKEGFIQCVHMPGRTAKRSSDSPPHPLRTPQVHLQHPDTRIYLK